MLINEHKKQLNKINWLIVTT